MSVYAEDVMIKLNGEKTTENIKLYPNPVNAIYAKREMSSQRIIQYVPGVLRQKKHGIEC